VHCKLIAALLAVVIVFAPNVALAGGSQGGETTSDSSGGAPQISTWVIGAINGGVKRPAGTKTCTPWEPLNGSTIELSNPNPIVIDPATGQPSTIYIRSCDGKFQYVYVGPHSPVDVAHVAYQKVAKLVPKPQATFSPPADRMVVNFESWLGVTPRPPVTATAAIPGLSATVTATPTTIEWSTGTKVAGDSETISCALWGSAQSAQDGCAWTPAYPSVAKVTGTNDDRYHGAVTIVWQVAWQATNGATGDLGELRTTTPVRMGVQEIQTIGG
jgi:hypothetical protein